MTTSGKDSSTPEHAEEQRSSADDVNTSTEPENHRHLAQNATAPDMPAELPPETGGQAGPEPTRYGDWEKKGRCTDF